MGAVPFNSGGFGVYWTDLVKLVIRLIDRGIEQMGAYRRLVGGQTFVVGEVDGLTSHRRGLSTHSAWPKLVAWGALFLVAATLGGGRDRPTGDKTSSA